MDEFYLVIVIGLSFLILFANTVLQKVRTYQKARMVKGKIIGYKFSGLPLLSFMYSPTRFWPMIETVNNGKKEILTVKNLNILLPIGKEIKFHFHDGKYFHLNLMGEAIAIGLCLAATLLVAFPELCKNSGYVFLFGLIISSLVMVKYFTMERDNLGTCQNLFSYIHPIKPEKYRNAIDSLDIKTIEQAEMVSYEDAMFHYYTYSKKTNRWCYGGILILLCMFLIYKNL